jgi:hypothetical protein
MESKYTKFQLADTFFCEKYSWGKEKKILIIPSPPTPPPPPLKWHKYPFEEDFEEFHLNLENVTNIAQHA